MIPNSNPSKFLFAALLLGGGLAVAGCAGSRQTRNTGGEFAPVTLSPDVIHSPGGDMTARLPLGWVTIDANKLESPQVFAMTCDPAYTVSIMFSEVPVDADAKDGFARGGLAGLADASLQRHTKRTGGRAVQVGQMEQFAIGRRNFSAYTYTTDSLKTVTRVAVFFTSTHLYECATTGLNFSGHSPMETAQLTALQQRILSTIEWE